MFNLGIKKTAMQERFCSYMAVSSVVPLEESRLKFAGFGKSLSSTLKGGVAYDKAKEIKTFGVL